VFLLIGLLIIPLVTVLLILKNLIGFVMNFFTLSLNCPIKKQNIYIVSLLIPVNFLFFPVFSCFIHNNN